MMQKMCLILYSMTMALQEIRVKQFKQKLEYALEDYYNAKSSLDPALLPLFSPHMEVVVRTVLPGWTTLTWSTMNIDAFLHRVEGSVGEFKAMVGSVMGVLKEKVYGSLDTIRKMSLFDVDLATSRMWVGVGVCMGVRGGCVAYCSPNIKVNVL